MAARWGGSRWALAVVALAALVLCSYVPEVHAHRAPISKASPVGSSSLRRALLAHPHDEPPPPPSAAPPPPPSSAPPPPSAENATDAGDGDEKDGGGGGGGGGSGFMVVVVIFMIVVGVLIPMCYCAKSVKPSEEKRDDPSKAYVAVERPGGRGERKHDVEIMSGKGRDGAAETHHGTQHRVPKCVDYSANRKESAPPVAMKGSADEKGKPRQKTLEESREYARQLTRSASGGKQRERRFSLSFSQEDPYGGHTKDEPDFSRL